MKQQMGLSKMFTCFYLLLLFFLLLLFQLESSTTASPAHVHGSARHGSSSFKPVSASSSSSSRHQFRPVESHGGFQGDNHHQVQDGDEVFGDEKRKVHTGPNPLHNR
ncbi:hypothetical protein COLO4_23432 [Corchorus olitorius]|uniref:Uncharacterized protein n=1 Tax=Corchorus olitorius TaxID=93759 RepID=A0A1R3IGQ6_9ROSI|nr:hypothetical protein COLO4_23432 [Corchorus olitorius]